MGIANSVTTSDGAMLKMPVLLSDQEARRKRHLQRRMARQVKGSNRRKVTKHSFAVLSERESSRRKDWIEKTTTDLVREFDTIAVEDLKIKNMVRSAKGTVKQPGTNVAAKRGLNRSIHAQAWGTFRTRLTDKATRTDSPVLVVAVPAANTSRRCSDCGHVAKENRKSQAVFLCQSCGHHEHADVNAAKNILAAGLAVTGRGGTSHAKTTGSKHSDPMKRQLLVGAAA
jgi:putative transposase